MKTIILPEFSIRLESIMENLSGVKVIKMDIGTADETLVMSRESFPLRMVRVWLNEDKTEYEILASNLPRDQFPADCFGELYHLRWRIEAAYQTLKDRLQMEN